jgi:hypothetical protein
MIHAKECEQFITIEALASPLINVEHTYRIPLFKDGKECGTTIPIVLFYGLKLRYISDCKMNKEEVSTEDELRQVLRLLLSNIHTLAKRNKFTSNDILIAKTFQRIIFRHIVWQEPLTITKVDQLLQNNARNKVHTVGDNISPSTTIPGFLCEWVLEKDKLNVDSPFKNVNSYIKRMGRQIHGDLKAYNHVNWKKSGSFSRRVQSSLMLEAFKRTFSSQDMVKPMFNPSIEG